jgi:2-amino-4-hydroxy-6-hydroxymethyldihydropteridine diphosphokinase
MSVVALSIGSNINPRTNLRQAIAALRSLFGDIVTSSVYESEAVGFNGDNFLNMVALINVDDSLCDLTSKLKALEDIQGRDRNTAKFSGRTLDIDVLTYDDYEGEVAGIVLPRPEITENAFVLLPLSEVLPESCHLKLNKTYAQLWSEYDKTKQNLWKIELNLLAG